MLPDELTINAMVCQGNASSGKVYSRKDVSANRSTYTEDGHTDAARLMLQFYRTLPKPSGNIRGIKRAAFKLTHDVTVPDVNGDNVVLPLILQVSLGIPVGTAYQNKIEQICGEAAALLSDPDVLTGLSAPSEVLPSLCEAYPEI